MGGFPDDGDECHGCWHLRSEHEPNDMEPWTGQACFYADCGCVGFDMITVAEGSPAETGRDCAPVLSWRLPRTLWGE